MVFQTWDMLLILCCNHLCKSENTRYDGTNNTGVINGCLAKSVFALEWLCWIVFCPLDTKCITGKWCLQCCMLLKCPAEFLLPAPSFSLVAPLVRASKHNHCVFESTVLWVGGNKPRDQESGINQTQMTWLASCDKCIQEGKHEKKRLTFESQEWRVKMVGWSRERLKGLDQS